jgi:RNA polymerase sigma-70 factor (ECF subfamily)
MHGLEHRSGPSSEAWFTTTHWSVVLAARQSASPDAERALERLCRTYWYPLYAFVRRQGRNAEDAQDLTQGFFARLLEKEYLRLADPARGRFRTFLLASLNAFLAEAHRHVHRLKRGGGQTFISWDALTVEQRYLAESRDESTAEALYEARWALTLLETVLGRLGTELASAGKDRLFAELKGHLWGEPNAASYTELAPRLGLSEGALKVAVHRLRRRFRQLLREEVARNVADPAEVDEELRHLVAVLRSSHLG